MTIPTYEEIRNRKGGNKGRGRWQLFTADLVPGEPVAVALGGATVYSMRDRVARAARSQGVPLSTAIIEGALYVTRLKPEDAPDTTNGRE